jgi:hypothetical protein
MERPSYDLVRTILRSKTFLAQNTEQRTITLQKMVETGETTNEEILYLINEEIERRQEENKEENKIDGESIGFFNNIDYNTFLTIISAGNITGESLLTLCNSSKKLNEYCSRSFQLRDAQGDPVGPEQDEYLFRVLLAKLKVPILVGTSPRKTYVRTINGGKVWSYGNNSYGQLGIGINGRIDGKNDLVIIPNLDHIVKIATGSSHSLCLDNKGRIWSFGNNNSGQLGLGPDRKYINIPTMIPDFSNIIEISTDSNSVLCLDDQGHVWSFGNNEWGQLGLNIEDENALELLIRCVSTSKEKSGVLDLVKWAN